MTQYATTLDEVLALRSENAELKAILKGTAETITRVAFHMPAPNPYTPDLVMMAQGIERAISVHG